MAGSQLEQRQASEPPDNQPQQSPATAAAITLAPRPPMVPPPRPRWQRRLAIIAGVSALGGLGGLLWWFVGRTPAHPYVLDFSPAASEYAANDPSSPALNWEISHPNQVETLTIRAYTADGTLVSGPDQYDLTGSLPVELLPHCEETKQRLTCQDVPTELRQPGQYVFKMTLLPRTALNLAPIEATTSLVTIADIPQPAVIELAPQQVIYSEAGTEVSANTPNLAPPVTDAGILVSWVVNHPETLQDLLLVVKQPEGGTLGGRRFNLRDAKDPTKLTLPEELKPFCQLGNTLVCRGVPTGMTQVGKYQFELTPVPVGIGEGRFPEARLSEAVEIQPRPVQIASFTVNGRNAEPKYVIPVEPGQPIPGFRIGWRVEGGSTTKVELLPSPGSVGLEGVLPLPLNPSGTTTVTLRVSDGQGQELIRAVTFETFDPTPDVPVIINQGGQPGPNGASPEPSPTPSATPQPDPLGETLRQSQSADGTGANAPMPMHNRKPEDLDMGF
ncbi:MAG: hypothetical protein ACFCVD_00750 [Nodosilinea sp.]